jgi:hypothetical protein
MTEVEWLACKDPKMLWGHCDREATERKKMLLRVAFCRHTLTVTNQTEQYEFELSVLEGCADGLLEHAVLDRVFNRLSWPAREARRPNPTFDDSPALFMEETMIAATAPGALATESTLALAQGAIEAAGFAGAPVRQPFVAFIRDVFGNPFHKRPKFDKRWRTDTVLALVRTMYDSREFSAMPILADAIQDAGCDNDDILDHCRDATATHVRGCWVVDLVLGKE